MNLARCPYFRTRPAVWFVIVAGAWGALLSCSSDPASTLGSDSDVLGSEPGTVYQDTIGVLGDTTYAMHTPIATDTEIETGLDSLYQHTIILQPGFAKLSTNPGDTLRTVQTASLHLATGGLGTSVSLPVRFYGLGYTYTEGDTVGSLSWLTDADAIVDTLAGTINRRLEAASQVYPIPRSLAQRWIRYPKQREAIAIIYTDTSERVALIPSQENSEDHPYLQVNFTDGNSRAYEIRDDATTYRPTTTTSNLVVSDGFPRRVFLRAELDSLAKDAAVHTAFVRFHIVPGTLVGTEKRDPETGKVGVQMLIYIPDSTDPAKAAFKTGQRVSEQAIVKTDDILEFPMANAIFLILQGTLKNNGFAIRFQDENTELRQVELYGTDAAPNLRPQVFVTSSTPAVFH